jgi:UDPglucose--hexose-1-phosphate uridylyltransferase
VSQLRWNPLTGRWVTVAAERVSRPSDFAPRLLPVEADPDRPCPFCPGNEEETAPALETYGPEGHWLVRVVPNLYPAFSGTEPLRIHDLGPVFRQAPGNGVHEVLVLSPDHKADWSELRDEQAALVMAALRDRMEDHARYSSVQYTQAIVNHGREAGASLEHPHGQLLGIPFVPGEIAEEKRGFERHAGDCLLCTVISEERAAAHRVVIDDERVLVLSPYWAGTPYELLVLPTTCQPHIARAAPRDLVAVGQALRDALRTLGELVGDFAYNIVFHTAPHHDDARFHWHVHVLPRLTSIAGFEQGTGVMINLVAPEQATQQLRSRIG